MKLNCPNCHNHISADQMNLDRMVAKCNRCDHLFSFADQFDTPPSPTMPTPKKVTVSQFNNELTLEWNWMESYYIILLVMTVFWDLVVVGFLMTGLMSVLNGDMLGLFTCLIPHVWVGVGLTYYTATIFINKTTITTTNNSFTVRHGPLPYRGNKEVDISTIKQLYTKHASIWGKNFGGGSRNSYYYLYAITHDNKEIKILSGLEEGTIPLFVEQQLERHFNIKDVPVPGEYGRR